MDLITGIDRRWLITIAGALLSSAVATYAWFDGDVSRRRDLGYERGLRRWLPIATEFRARHLGLVRVLIRLTQSASKIGILPPTRARAWERSVVRQVRFEARPVYVSGRHGEWDDTGIRWRLPE